MKNKLQKLVVEAEYTNGHNGNTENSTHEYVCLGELEENKGPFEWCRDPWCRRFSIITYDGIEELNINRKYTYYDSINIKLVPLDKRTLNFRKKQIEQSIKELELKSIKKKKELLKAKNLLK